MLLMSERFAETICMTDKWEYEVDTDSQDELMRRSALVVKILESCWDAH